MADIIDIDVFQTVTSVSFEVEPNTNIININKVTVNGGGGGGTGEPTNLTTSQTSTNFTINSSTGTDAVVPLGNGTLAGATLNDYTTAEKNKLAGIQVGANLGVPYTGATANVNLGEFGLTTGQVTLDITPTGTATVGTTQWNDSLGSSETTLKGGTVVLRNGVDLVARIVNKVTPNTTLTKAAYQAVRVSGATGQRLSVELAQGDADLNSADTIGLVTETIATNQEGFIITMGQIEDINTTGSLQGETWSDGDVLYLSPTVAGRLTNIKPTGATGHIVVIGYVEYAHAIHGKIYVKIMNGWELDELHNVFIDNPLNNEGLFYELSTSLWKNKSIATALGYTPYNATNPSGYQTASQVQTIADAKVVQTITNGVTTTAPSQDAVFDALALKANDSNVVHLTGNETIAGLKTFTDNLTAGRYLYNGGSIFPEFGSTFYINGDNRTHYFGGGTSNAQNNLEVSNGTLRITLQTASTIASFDANKNVVSLTTANGYPTLTELKSLVGVSTTAIQTQLNGKQATLQSTVNIKSINGNSILGSGDLVISGGSAQTGTIVVTSGTSFTTPSTITTSTVFIIELVGAGGGGGGGATGTSAGGSGAGSGGYVYKVITGLTPSTTYTCAIGVGGTAGAFTGNGTAGTSTTLTIGATTYTASGGGFGIGVISSAGGIGGTGTNGDININGQNGGDSLTAAASVPSSAGGSSPKGWGLGGLGVLTPKNGNNATGYGGGGSAGKGTTGNPTGGTGSNGIIYCQYYN